MSEKERRDYRSLGEILADARAEREMTVEQVSERTKIAPRMITSLENDELENLSGPVYARGFLRSLCQLYGLDHAWMMSKLEAGLETTSPTPVIDVPPVPSPAGSTAAPTGGTDESTDRGGPSEQTWKIEKVDSARVRRIRTQSRRGIPRKVWAILVVVLVLAAIVFFGLSLFGDESSAWIDRASEGTIAVTQEDLSPSSPTPEQPTISAAEASEADRQPDPGPESTDEPEPTTTVVSSATGGSGTEAVSRRDVRSEGLGSIVRLEEEAVRTPMLLEIQARYRVEVEVIIDGRRKERRTLRAGEMLSLQAFQRFELDISDHDAVVVELDGIRREPPPRLDKDWVWQLYRDASTAE